MSIMEKSNPEEEQNNIVPFTAIGGGKGGGPWLCEYEVGTNFLAKSNQSNIDLFEYWIVAKGERAYKLVLVQNMNEEKYYWVDPEAFSKVMTLYEILEH